MPLQVPWNDASVGVAERLKEATEGFRLFPTGAVASSTTFSRRCASDPQPKLRTEAKTRAKKGWNIPLACIVDWKNPSGPQNLQFRLVIIE